MIMVRMPLENIFMMGELGFGLLISMWKGVINTHIFMYMVIKKLV